jgi:hypothetical protein
MIRQHTKRSPTCCFLAALISLAAPFGARAVEPIVLIQDNFEAVDAPSYPWTDVMGCPARETTDSIDGQSLRFHDWFDDGCEAKEPDVICHNLAAPPANMVADFYADLADLDLPEDGSFEIFTFLELQPPPFQAVSVKLGRTNDRLWVILEAMEEDGIIVGSPRYDLDWVLHNGTLLNFLVSWDRGDDVVKNDGSAALWIDGVNSSVEIHLEGLKNQALEPDYVRLGVGDPEPPEPGMDIGSFVLDTFVLWTLAD